MLSKTQESRVEFVNTEMDTCFQHVKDARAALSAGDLEQGKQYARAGENGYENIVKFLAEIESTDRRAQIEHRWNQLRAELDDVQTQLTMRSE
jgi:hypothetical protein